MLSKAVTQFYSNQLYNLFQRLTSNNLFFYQIEVFFTNWAGILANSERINPIALAIIVLCLSEEITQLHT